MNIYILHYKLLIVYYGSKCNEDKLCLMHNSNQRCVRGICECIKNYYINTQNSKICSKGIYIYIYIYIYIRLYMWSS